MSRTVEEEIVERCLRDTERQGISTRSDATALERIRQAAAKAAVELRSTERTDVNLPFIAAGGQGPIHIALAIRRSDLGGSPGLDGPARDPRVKLG